MECRVTLWNRIGAALLGATWIAMILGVSYLQLDPELRETALLLALVPGWIMTLLLVPFLGPIVFSTRPIITLSADGIDDVRFRLGLIPWSDVTSFDTYGVDRRPYVQLWLRSERDYTSKWPLWRRILGSLARAIGYSPFSMSFSFLTPGFGPTCEYLRNYVVERRDS